MKSYKIFVINRICVQYYSNFCIPFSVKQMSSLTGEHHDKPTQDFQNKIISKSIYQLNDLYTLREKQPKLSNVWIKMAQCIRKQNRNVHCTKTIVFR